MIANRGTYTRLPTQRDGGTRSVHAFNDFFKKLNPAHQDAFLDALWAFYSALPADDYVLCYGEPAKMVFMLMLYRHRHLLTDFKACVLFLPHAQGWLQMLHLTV